MCKQCPKNILIDGYMAIFQPCPNPNCLEKKARARKQEQDLQDLMDAYGIVLDEQKEEIA